MNTYSNTQIMDALSKRSSRGNTFAKGLLDQLLRNGSLSPKQMQYAQQFAKEDDPTSNPQTEPKVKVGLGVLEALNTAKSNGLKRPRLVFANEESFDGRDVEIQMAKPGRNEGCAYVRVGSIYYGKIVPNDGFDSRRHDPQPIYQFLQRIDADPAFWAQKAGRATGSCCFCSRRLTDPVSVELGYGPVCADRFGMTKTRLNAPRAKQPDVAEPVVEPVAEPVSSLDHIEGFVLTPAGMR